MNGFKKAFTMAEILVVLVIMGVIIVFGLHSANNRPYDYYTRYYSAYDALNKAAYNTYTDTYCRVGEFSTTETYNCTDAEKTNGRPFPTTAEKLCERLTQYINASYKNCSDNYIPNNSTLSNDSFADDKAKKEYNKALQFIASNGFKFYFTQLQNDAITTYDNKKISFFIVYVDLNGALGPNRVNQRDGSSDNIKLAKPDIVPFAVTTTGDVVPMGYPVFDKVYISARILPSVPVTDTATNITYSQTGSFTFDEARQIAFGSKTFKDMPLGIKFNDKLSTNALPTGARPTRTLGDTGLPSALGSNPFGCAEGTYNCTLKIDENLEKRF